MTTNDEFADFIKALTVERYGTFDRIRHEAAKRDFAAEHRAALAAALAADDD